MALFSSKLAAQINEVAAKSNEPLLQASAKSTRSVNDDLIRISNEVKEHFADSKAILITKVEQLHDYISKCIEYGYASIDTETTGLDRIRDHIVGFSLYVPGMPECYIPNKHVVPLFETLYKNQLTYEDCQPELQRLVDNKVKLILANFDFDCAMIRRSFGVDISSVLYYDVISAWRCLKENELDNSLKGLYAKYVMKGKIDRKKFSDFFTPALFPYCNPEIAKLYAANDAKITFELFLWQLPYVTKTDPKCQKHHLEKIADLLWNLEVPNMARVCADLHRRGIYLDETTVQVLHERYSKKLEDDQNELASQVQSLIDEKDVAFNKKRPFRTGKDFNCNSSPHLKYLFEKLMGKEMKSYDKEAFAAMKGDPVVDGILKVRNGIKLLGTYIDKMPKIMDPKDHRVHPSFKSMGAATGRMASESPNAQNIPSHALDIRHMFRATPEQTEVIKLQEEDGVVEMFLMYKDKVRVPSGLKYVDELTKGDIVILKDGGVDTEATVDEIELSNGRGHVILNLT